MANFKKILTIKGVILVGEFSSNGELIAYDGDFPIELAKELSSISSINNITNKHLLENLLKYSKIKMENLQRVILDMENYYLFIYSDIFLIVNKEKSNIHEILLLDISKYKDL